MSQRLDLARPFPLSLIADNPSGFGSYVPHPIYKQKLLLILGGYDFELVEVMRGSVKGHDELGEVIVGVMMRLTAVVDGERRVIEEAGDCEQPNNWPHDGARLKDAVSDAFKRCCPHLGLGLHLYVKEATDYVLFKLLQKQENADTQPPQDTPPADVEFADDDPGRPFDAPPKQETLTGD